MMPFGAEVLPQGGVRFRLWAPAAKTVEVVFKNESFPLRKTDDGWGNHALSGFVRHRNNFTLGDGRGDILFEL